MNVKNLVKKVLYRTRLYNLIYPINQRIKRELFKGESKRIQETGKVGYPRSMLIEITGRCNLNCEMCYLSKDFRHSSKHMSLDDIKTLLKNIPNTVKSVMLTGGEVFTRPDMMDILRIFKDNGISVHITTNGTLINESKVKMMEKLGNVISCGISIDGNEELHNKIRGLSFAYSKAVYGARMMAGKFRTSVVCVVQKDNLSQLKDVVDLAAKTGIKSVYFEYERLYSKEDIEQSMTMLELSPSDFEELHKSENLERGYSLDELSKSIADVKSKGKELGVSVNFFPYFLNNETELCYKRKIRDKYICSCFALPTLRISTLGDVSHCFAVRKNFGNLLNQDFDRIWNSEDFIKFRKNLLSNNLTPICETCLYQRILSKKN